jgi:hypothetical protein
MHKLIHPVGMYQDETHVGKNVNLANWSWKGHVTKAIIQKILKDEKKED